MRNNRTQQFSLFVYDIKNGLWHREDNTKATHFCTVDNVLYMSTEDRLLEPVNPISTSTILEGDVEWFAETGKLGMSLPDKKYLSRLDIRIALELDAKVRISIQYDSLPTWQPITVLTGTKLDSFTVPIRPKRCDHFRLRFEGKGNIKVYSVCKTIEQGSNV